MVNKYLDLRLDECLLALKGLEHDYRINNSKESLKLLLDIVKELEIPQLVTDMMPNYEAQA
tara:strand:+ start:548 stop:730 length:183 start_codon:yes stop_codon:yes gene_type:complete